MAFAVVPVATQTTAAAPEPIIPQTKGNHNYFLKSIAQGLTPKIAEQSIYAYLEQVLHVAIVTSKRTMTVEKMTEIDEKYLDLGDCNCLAVVSSQTYNGDGVMFEYTQSRHRPDYFCFRDNATRHP